MATDTALSGSVTWCSPSCVPSESSERASACVTLPSAPSVTPLTNLPFNNQPASGSGPWQVSSESLTTWFSLHHYYYYYFC